MRWFRGLRHTHAHFCSCGAELRCTQPIDRCGVSRAWECAACEQRQIDAYISRLELDARFPRVDKLNS